LHNTSSKHSLRVIEASNEYLLPFTGATGRVLFSQLSDEEIRETLRKINSQQFTGHSVIDSDNLLAQLKEIRQQGYAISYGEIIAGAICMAAPIRNYIHPAALAIIGPESRVKPRLADITKALKLSADRISSIIGEVFHERR
jgi:IclR family acetate operon transcriptional repressor